MLYLRPKVTLGTSLRKMTQIFPRITVEHRINGGFLFQKRFNQNKICKSAARDVKVADMRYMFYNYRTATEYQTSAKTRHCRQMIKQIFNVQLSHERSGQGWFGS
jgi:hypothetical protein